MNIVLIGFMGAGKSTVGKLIAQKLKRKFYDCDELIVQKTELSIEEIFRLYGEIKFRTIETEVLKNLSRLEDVVIATGGGAITRYRNVELIKKNGVVIYLYADLLELYERIKKDKTKRPLVADKNFFNTMARLISQREELYDKIADIKIDTTVKTTQEVLRDIIKELKNRGYL
ncbi:MAG: shikimate kinase [Planctomycetota bacterium]